MRKVCVVLLGLLTLAFLGCGSDEPRPDPTPPGLALRLLAPAFEVQAGSQGQFVLTVDRQGGYEGPIQVELRGLPEGVTHSPVLLPASPGDTGVSLTVAVGSEVPSRAYLVDVVATGGTLTASERIALQVTPDPALGEIGLAFEAGVPSVLKGETHSLTVQVDRTRGFNVGFRIDAGQVAPGLNIAAVSVEPDAASFTLELTVDERRPVGRAELPLMVRAQERMELVMLELDVTAPEEAAPQLTAANPPDLLWGKSSDIVLSGSGLSGTTSVVLRPASGPGEPVPAQLLLAGSTEARIHLRVPYTEALTAAHVLELTTAAGTVTLPFELSTPHVDPAAGSDAEARGTRASPFATIARALSACGTCVLPQCGHCPVRLAPGVHRPGTLNVRFPAALVGLGALYGEDPTVIEGATGVRFNVWGAKLESVKVTGFERGIETQALTESIPELTDVWVTGNGYGIQSQTWVTVSTRNATSRIENNRFAGIAAVVTLLGSEEHPIEITGNGDGLEDAGGVIGAVELARHVRVERNRGAGVQALKLKARDSTFRDNEGPGVWVAAPGSSFGVDLGTPDSPGGNTLQGNAPNLRVDTRGPEPVFAVGNCWDVPTGGDFAEARADGACGRMGARFERNGVTYVNDEGRALVPFTWTGTPRFNYWLSEHGAGGGTGIQF